MSKNLSQAESYKSKLQSEIIRLRAGVNTRRKIECETTPLRATILEQQEKLYDVKMECFNEVKKMTDKTKSIEKHLEFVSQTYQRLRDMQAKIVEL